MRGYREVMLRWRDDRVKPGTGHIGAPHFGAFVCNALRVRTASAAARSRAGVDRAGSSGAAPRVAERGSAPAELCRASPYGQCERRALTVTLTRPRVGRELAYLIDRNGRLTILRRAQPRVACANRTGAVSATSTPRRSDRARQRRLRLSPSRRSWRSSHSSPKSRPVTAAGVGFSRSRRHRAGAQGRPERRLFPWRRRRSRDSACGARAYPPFRKPSTDTPLQAFGYSVWNPDAAAAAFKRRFSPSDPSPA